MLVPPKQATEPAPVESRPGRYAALLAFADRWPFPMLFLLIVLSNGSGSVFNIAYNNYLIIRYLEEDQKQAFRQLLPVYNVVAYPICLTLAIVWLFRPLARCLDELRGGRPVRPAHMERCRYLLVNLPYYQVCLNVLGWAPGAVVFPLGICLLGGWENADYIWIQFFVSFFVSTLLVTTQTFFSVEWFLVRVLYPEFFRDARPADVVGVRHVPFGVRLGLFWFTVTFVPMAALLTVALNFTAAKRDFNELRGLAIGVFIVAGGSAALIAWMVGENLRRWLSAHSQATEQIAMGDDEIRIRELRHDEWGKLTDRFNEMAAALGRARYVRETFGQFVGVDLLEEILDVYRGLGGDVQTITVMFADIRGFTQRTAGEAPERVVELLNRYLTLAVGAIEDPETGGLVNKFLGDGFMALFGAHRRHADHADRAVRAARQLLAQVNQLNGQLVADGQAPLAIGIGIHTGPALVGCIGATMKDHTGRQRLRKEFTAIGETVNLSQRLEQLTKTCGGPVILSEQTRACLREPARLIDVEPQCVPGFEQPIKVYRLDGCP
ncbi:MAG TPA: adenylate/guanylate cyclase domain-containing protein [Gemmataceae bacterium]|jgi:adenylate cyclase|nr:adenylate/guanylate cyclase domain-containing protein [Gemmataceae bacterium]